jgi:sugar phosphate isomerase/epimerase
LSEKFKIIEIELEGKIREQTKELQDIKVAYELKKIAQSKKVLLNIHAPYIRVDFLIGNFIEEGRELVKQSAEFANIVGANVMTFHPGFRFPKNPTFEQRRDAVEKIILLSNELDKISKRLDSNVIYCLENSGNERPYLTLTNEEHEEIFSKSNLKLTMDMTHTASYSQSIENICNDVARTAKYAANVHLADMNFPKHIHLPLGKGTIPYHSMVMAVEKTGYKGAYIVEEIGCDYTGYDYVNAAIEYKERLEVELAA